MVNEVINLDVDSLENGGDNLYVAESPDGVLVFEERPGEPVAEHGGYVTATDSPDPSVYKTVGQENAEVVLVPVENPDEEYDRIFAAELEVREVPVETLNKRGWTALELVN